MDPPGRRAACLQPLPAPALLPALAVSPTAGAAGCCSAPPPPPRPWVPSEIPLNRARCPRHVTFHDLRLTKAFALPAVRVTTARRAVLWQGGVGRFQPPSRQRWPQGRGQLTLLPLPAPCPRAALLAFLSGKILPQASVRSSSISGSADHFPKGCTHRALKECQK